MNGELLILPDYIEGKSCNFTEFKATQKGSFLFSSSENFFLNIYDTVFGS